MTSNVLRHDRNVDLTFAVISHPPRGNNESTHLLCSLLLRFSVPSTVSFEDMVEVKLQTDNGTSEHGYVSCEVSFVIKEAEATANKETM